MPFLVFYWMLPFISSVTIGNDYLRFSVLQQMELQFSLKTGSFPMYVPGFASGHSSSALTLGQLFHPLSHIASMLPGYWDGNAVEWNSFLKLLSLGLCQLILFLFLQKMKLSSIFSFLLSFITVYNLRIADLFRHGTPLEAYTGFLILCSVIGWYFIKPHKWLGPVSIIGATYLLICNGHPEEMYYGLLGAGLFAFAAPFYLSTMLPDRHVNLNVACVFWLKTFFCFFLGILLSSVYIVPFYFDFIQMNIDRVGQSYAWADSELDTVIGTLNNFLMPLRSDVNSAFGGSSLILIAVIIPALRLVRIKVPLSIYAIWGLLLFMFLFMQGNRTPVHRLVWEHLPFASSIRVAGRITIIMPFFIMLLLAWIARAGVISLRLGRYVFTLKPLTLSAVFALLIIIIFYLLHIAGYYVFQSPILWDLFSDYSAGHFLDIPFPLVELITILLGASSLIFLIVHDVSNGRFRWSLILLTLLTIIQLCILISYRSAFWSDKKYASSTFEEMKMQKMNTFEYIYYPGGGLHSSVVMTQLKRSFMEPYLGKIFTSVIAVTDQEDGYTRMEQERFPHQVFVEGYDPQKAMAISARAKDLIKGSVTLVYNSFNRLQFSVYAEEPAFFGLSYPYTGNWEATVNGNKVNVYRANGAAHAIEIPAGVSEIEFKYWSSAWLWGMLVSCITFAAIGTYISCHAFQGKKWIISAVIIIIISTSGFLQWYHGLFNGNNLQTKYEWNYTTPVKAPNIAYGKKSRTASDDIRTHWADRERELYSNRFVDGDSSPCSGFTTLIHNNPAWILDLSKIMEIKTIVLYERCKIKALIEGPTNMLHFYSREIDKLEEIPPVNARPLSIAFSNDGDSWRAAAFVTLPLDYNRPERIVFDSPQTTRYIRITASGRSKLMFDEVEVYGH